MAIFLLLSLKPLEAARSGLPSPRRDSGGRGEFSYEGGATPRLGGEGALGGGAAGPAAAPECGALAPGAAGPRGE